MSYPSFTTGEVLTAADMNAVGLWLVKSETIGTGVSSVTVTDAFNANYDHYLVTIAGQSSTAINNLLFQLSGATGSSYFTNLMYWSWGSATLSGYGPSATTSSVICQLYTGLPYAVSLQLFNPNSVSRTYGFLSQTGANNGGVGQIMETSSAQHTGFTITPSTGTITGGTICVYGYRN